MRKQILAAMCVALVSATPALATDSNSNMTVSATVVTACTIGTPDTLSFGGAITSTGSAITAQANIPVTCSNGGSYKVFLDNGLNYASSTRRMANGSNYMSYALYSDSARSTAFPVDATGSALTGTASLVNTVVYGTIPAQATPPVGAYADTLQITVRY